MEPLNKILMLQKVLSALDKNLDTDVAWFKQRVQLYLRRDASDLGACLGLRPRQGGRYETPQKLERMQVRDQLISQVSQLIPGSISAKASTLAEWIKTGGPPPDSAKETHAKYRELLDAFPRILLGNRQISRVLKGETIAARRAIPGFDIKGPL